MTNFLISSRKYGPLGEPTWDVGPTTYVEIEETAPTYTLKNKLNLGQWLDHLFGTSDDSVLVFIHGFANNAEDIVTRHKLIKPHLPPHVSLVSFDWPSGNPGDTAEKKYEKDKANAAAVAQRLVGDCLSGTVLFKKFTQANIHLFAHSMGAYVTEQAFQNSNEVFKVGRVLLAAADVDRLNYSGSLLSNYLSRCSDLTAYWSQDDEALKTSIEAAINNKAVPLGLRGFPDPEIPDGCKAIECTAYYERYAIKARPSDMKPAEYSHVWYMFYQPSAPLVNDFYTDMAEVLRRSLTIRTRTQKGYERLRTLL